MGDVYLTPQYPREYYDLARFTERAVALGWFAWSLGPERGTGGMMGREEHIKEDTVSDFLDLKSFHDDIGAAILRTDH